MKAPSNEIYEHKEHNIEKYIHSTLSTNYWIVCTTVGYPSDSFVSFLIASSLC